MSPFSSSKDVGLTNLEEYFLGTDPLNPDTDGGGTSDGDEVLQGSDPNDASDNGLPPPPDSLVEISFHIYGDYAA